MPKEGQKQHNRMDAYLRACSGSRREKFFRRRPNKKWLSRDGLVLAGRILPKYLFFADRTGFMSEEGGNIFNPIIVEVL